jgi:LacI family transcriptional regulator
MPITMKQVALRAGVAASTVSRVLNKTHYMSAETQKRVLDAVEAMGYYKNVHAKRLATGQSDLFGLVVSEIANPYFPEIIRGFQAAAWEHNFEVLLCNTEYIPERTRSVIEKLVQSDVRGIAIVTASIDSSMTPQLIRAGIGIVFCNLCDPGKLVSNITINYERGVLQAIDHVVSLGHRTAAIIAGPETNRTATNIKQALIKGLQSKGIKPFPVTSANYQLDAGSSAVRAILSAKEMPTAIFCGSDLIAMGAMTALEEAGVRIPEDVSVVGIDDISFSSLARPPLTTIGVPRERLGVTAFEALHKMLALKRKMGSNYTLDTELVVRKSTGPCKKGKMQGSAAARRTKMARSADNRSR